MSVNVQDLMARIAELEKQNAALAAHAPPISGKLNHSKPRDDGRKGSAFFGSITLAESAKPGATYNVAVYENVNSKTGESFFNVVFRGEYVREEAKQAVAG